MIRFFVLFFLLVCGNCFGQTPGQLNLKDKLEKLSTNFPQEKIYIHFDKPAYTIGETIWCKAYIMSADLPSDICKTLYIDLSDADGKTLRHIAAPISKGAAKAQFDIPEAYKFNGVFIRAYTRWMLNFDSAFLYNKYIPIIQPGAGFTKATEPAVKTFIQFLPEGGDAVAGIPNRIAFKAVHYNGMPATVKGVILNSKAEQVTEINSVHDGMGYFVMLPIAGETYTAKWKDEQGNSFETALPLAKPAGVNIEIKDAPGKKGFIIRRSPEVPANFNHIHIVATMQQQLVYMASVKLDVNPAAGGSIPTEELTSGIMQITLFDSNWVAFAERITFVDNDDYKFEPEVGFSALSVEKRGKNTLVISMPDKIESNLSVSVTDAGIGIDSTDNIFSRLLITGDLKGTVYKPVYYFSAKNDTVRQNLDLVMLTNGWRRIKWDNLLNGKMPAIKYPNDVNYLSFGGKVYGVSQTELRQGAMLMMIVDNRKDSLRQVMQSILDEQGSFAKPELIFYDTLKVYYQLAGTGNIAAGSEVTFNSGMMPPPRQNNFSKDPYELLFNDTSIESRNRWFAQQKALLDKLLEGTTLEGVTVKTKVKSPVEIMDAKYTSGLFSGGDAVQFDVANDPAGRGALTPLTYLQGRVAGLSITAANTTNGQNGATWRGGSPDFYLDEFKVDISTISTININDIAYIKVFRPPFMGNFSGGASGAIAIYTRRGGDIINKPSKGLPYKMAIGYTAQKEFYSPSYVTTIMNDVQDIRSTLYWNPMILTTAENHVIKIPFYNNDVTKSFRVIVEGVSADGKLTRVEKVIE